MSERVVKILEGVGTVYRGDAPLQQSANYRIGVYREFISSGIGNSEVPGMFSIRGTIDGGLPIGESLKLVTAQFSCEFFVRDSNGTMIAGSLHDAFGKPLDFERL
jgi:hypothetical protein